MQRVRRARGFSLVVIVGVLYLGLLGSRESWGQTDAQSSDEDAAGLVKKICSSCHGAVNFEAMRRSRSEWERLVTEMVDYGMNVTDEERATIVDFLATHYGPKDPDAPADSGEKGDSTASATVGSALMAGAASAPAFRADRTRAKATEVARTLQPY